MSVVKEKKVEYLGRQIKQLREMVNNCKEEGYCNEQTIDIVRSYYNDIETYVYDPEFEEHHYEETVIKFENSLQEIQDDIEDLEDKFKKKIKD